MSVTRALALNTGVQIAGKIVSTIFGIVIVGLMTRYLGQKGFGAYSTANAYLQIFALLLDLGLNVTIVSMLGEHAGDEAYERRAVSSIFTFRVLIGFIIFALAIPVAWLFPYDATIKLAIVALIGSFFFTSLNQIVIGVQQRHLKMHAMAISENIGRAVLLIGLIIAIKLGWGLLPIVWIVSLGSLANFIINILVARRYAHFSWNIDPAFWWIALKRSWPIGLSIAFNLIYYKSDTLVLSLVRSQAEVGIYGAAYRVLDIVVTIPFMYAGVLLPILSGVWAAKNKERFAHLLGQSVHVMVLLIAPIVVGTFILGTRFMALIAGDDFASAGNVLKVLILAAGFIYVNTVFSHAIVALQKQRAMIPWYIVIAILALIGYILYIPKYGMWAAAWLTVFSEGAITIGSIWVTRRVSHTHLPTRQLTAAIAASAIMGFGVWFTQSLWLPIPFLVAAALYPAALFILGGISLKTLKEILSARKSSSPTLPNSLS
ncbi:flippase [Candidatus Uhrbacteria bacterium]|nr:flippase [Candidatus Uhrbacteria bacterium]